MTDFAWRSAGTRVAALAAMLACTLAAGASAAALLPAADAVARGPAPSHGGFSCRGPVPRHPSAKAYVVGYAALIPVDLATGKAGKPLPYPDTGDKQLTNTVASNAPGSTCPPGGTNPACSTTVTASSRP